MTMMSAIPVTSRLVGLRLHTRRGPGGVPESGRARMLLDLESRNLKREADEKVLRDLLAEATNQVRGIPGVVAGRLDEIAGIAVELGLSIAREIVGKAIDDGNVDPTEVVTRCLRDCVHGSDRGDLVIRLNPDDLASVKTNLSHMPDLDEEVASARFVPDATIPSGGVRAETGAGRMLYNPREVLDRICEEVRREASE